MAHDRHRQHDALKAVTGLALAAGLALALLPAPACAETPVREAVKRAAEAPDWLPRLHAVYEALAPLPNSDFPEAIDCLAELPIKSPVLAEAIGYWIERDAAGAKAWLDADPDKRSVYGEPVCNVWVRVDLAGFVEWVNGPKRARHFWHHARQALFETFAREDPAMATEWSLKLPKSPGGGGHVYSEQEFFGEWANHDALAAATRALAIPAGDVRLEALKGVMSSWSARDREGADRWANALEDPALRRHCAATLVTLDKIRQQHGLAATQPAQPAAAPKLPPAPEMAAALNHASNMHIQHDYFVLSEKLGPEAAVLALESVWQERDRRVFRVFFGACSAWAEKDLAAFRAHVEQMADKETASIARMALMRRWQRTDEAAALAWAGKLPAAERDSLLRSNKVYEPKPKDPNEALAKVTAEPGHFGEATTILTNWAKEDPEAASARALAFTKKIDRMMAVSGVLRGWAEKDPAAALAWVQKLDEALRREACGSLFESWARRDLDAALATARTLEDELRPIALGPIAPILLARDRERGLALLETIPLPQAGSGYLALGKTEPATAIKALWRREAAQPPDKSPMDRLTVESETGIIVREWAERDLPTAAAFVMAQPENRRADLYGRIIEAWKKTAPQEAVEWVFTLPDFNDPMRFHALETAIGHWEKSSEKEVGAWVDALAKGPKRDAAIAALVRAMMPHSPDAALTRARTIGDPRLQRETLYLAWFQWLASPEKKAAERWRDSDALTPAEKQLLKQGL